MQDFIVVIDMHLVPNSLFVEVQKVVRSLELAAEPKDTMAMLGNSPVTKLYRKVRIISPWARHCGLWSKEGDGLTMRT